MIWTICLNKHTKLGSYFEITSQFLFINYCFTYCTVTIAILLDSLPTTPRPVALVTLTPLDSRYDLTALALSSDNF